METNLSKAIDITNDTARYDESVKELLADKQVLARILKYSVEEFAELSLDEIIKSISEPDIAGIRVEPGMTNLGKVEKQSEEDFVPGEGKNIYDIRFVAYLGTEMIKFLINVEAQKSTKHYDLGYHLDNRIIFYLFLHRKKLNFLIRIMITSKQLEASGYVWILTQMKILLTESGLCRRMYMVK